MPKLIENFIVDNVCYDTLNTLLENSGAWNDVMCIENKNKPIKSEKTGCFFGVRNDHGSLPYFRCPSFFEAVEIPTWLRENLLSEVNKYFDKEFNLVKIQKYVNGKSGIARHSDKGLDMDPDCPILIYRVNREREKTRSLSFKNKITGNEIKIDMPSNSLVVITPVENKELVHYVSNDESGASDECISFVFRKIDTYIDPSTNFKYGIGAKYKTYEERYAHADLNPVDMRDSKIITDIVTMYNFENTHNLLEDDVSEFYNRVAELTI